VLPEIESVNGVTWVHIRTLNNIEGWVLQSVLAATRQTPVFTPTFTLTATSTPTP
jgi:SH3-like domain-containing protein